MDRHSLTADSVLDIHGALDRLGGDETLLADMIGFFIEDAPPLMDQIRTAVKVQDAAKARRAAHTLKGLILGCGGVRAARVAREVEDAAHTGDLSGISPLVEDLIREVGVLIEASSPYSSRRGASPSRLKD